MNSCLKLLKSKLKLPIPKRSPSTPFKNIQKKPDVIIFDYDGTIVNNDKYVMKAIKYAIHKNLDKKKIKVTKKFKIDNEYWDFIKYNCSNDVFVKCNYDYDYYLSLQKLCKIRGVLKLIKLFAKHKKPMLVVSQKCGLNLRKELKKCGLMSYFKNAYGTLDFEDLRKPTKDFVDAVKNDANIKNEHCWIIGDRHSDATMALNFSGKAFIIGNNDVQKIQDEYRDLIGDDIFFTSYARLTKFVKKFL